MWRDADRRSAAVADHCGVGRAQRGDGAGRAQRGDAAARLNRPRDVTVKPSLVTSLEQSRADPGAYLCVVFEVRDRSGRIVYTENTRASDQAAWQMNWVSPSKLCLRSSEIGS